MLMETLFSSVTFASTLRTSTPLILAAVGGCYGNKAGIFNIALESFILISAFFATWGSYAAANAYVGLLCGILAGFVCAIIFSIFVFHLGSDGMVVSIAMNLGAWGFTTLMMSAIFDARGSFVDPRIISLPAFDIPGLGAIPFVSDVFNNHNILVYFSIVSIALMWIIMYKTPFGLRVSGVGINAAAAEATGTNMLSLQWAASFITGLFCGMAGAVLPLGGTSVFTENMSAGRGFLAVAAILLAKGNPLVAGLTCVLFAYTDALTVGLENLGIPSQLVQTLPYVATILVLLAFNIKQFTGRRSSCIRY